MYGKSLLPQSQREIFQYKHSNKDGGKIWQFTRDFIFILEALPAFLARITSGAGRSSDMRRALATGDVHA